MAEITENTKKILEVILNLKEGQVMSYRDVGALAGLPNGARQVLEFCIRCLKNMNCHGGV
ncbi:hypothetical protein [Lactococcus lactis]|uniref:hypothetical protein n=1 Tax=Lactococcus lactis TaxID=1358 RepID=UPI003A805A37